MRVKISDEIKGLVICVGVLLVGGIEASFSTV